jgi:dihydropteroate synthase
VNRLLWKVRRATLDLGQRGAIMGILNVTPDSFSDGGAYDNPERAVEHALAMERDGAEIIDIGGESTRPGALPVPADEEIRRVVPVIERLRAESDVLISIDTSKATVARAAMEAGADIINDVTGFSGDPDMAAVARDTNAGVVLMHMRGTPQTMQQRTDYHDVVAEVREFLRQQMERAIACGIDPMRIVLDPGIGFAKTAEQNLSLLRHCDRFAVNDRPVLIGVSRKSLLAKLAGSTEPADRFWPGVAITALCRRLGARVFRVHDPLPHLHALRMTEAILNPVA